MDLRDLHKVFLQSAFQGVIAMNRHRDTGNNSFFRVDMMAAVDPLQLPSSIFEKLAKLFPADGFHTVISMIRSASEIGTSRTSTDRHPSIAS